MLKSGEVIEFCPYPKSRVGIPTPSKEDPRLSESYLKDDPLVSDPIEPVTLLLRLLIPSLGKRVKLTAVLDLV